MRESRIRTILNIIRERDFVTHQVLADELNVSLSTIRRDLSELASRNLVVISKSGVIPISETVVDTPLHFRSKINAKAKSAITNEALGLIKNGNTIFLDSSSTVLGMVDGLRSFRNLIIVTNSIYIATRLSDSLAKVHLLGGEMSRPSHGFFGSATLRALENFNMDISFISPVAITPSGYAAQTAEESAEVRRAVIRRSTDNVLLFDHSKVGLLRPYNIAHLRDFSYIITDDKTHSFDTSAVIRRVDSVR